MNIDSDEEVDFTKMDLVKFKKNYNIFLLSLGWNNFLSLFLKGNKKGPVNRWDFDTNEEYSDYMSNREALPK